MTDPGSSRPLGRETMWDTREFLPERNCRRKPPRRTAFIGTPARITHVRNTCGDYAAYTTFAVCDVTVNIPGESAAARQEREREREREREIPGNERAR